MIRPLYRFPRPPLVMLALVSMAELGIADRKYGVFTGGFGQSRAVDTLGERTLFFLGYLCAQWLFALLLWMLVARLTRRKAQWVTAFHFAIAYGGLGVAAIAGQYQLHSYFSDAVGFTLIKQLGGGSLVDAILFGLKEILSAGGLLVGGIALWWLAWRLVRRRWSDLGEGALRPRLGRVLALSTLAYLVAAFFIPRSGSDAAFGLDRTLVWGTGETILSQVTDFDRDGYGLFGIKTDSHPFDGARHPLALDVPGNGVDEDGYGGDLTLVSVPHALPAIRVPATGQNLILVVMESTRGDAIGKRVNGKLVAPVLTALARQGSWSAPSYSHVGFTTASLKSIFSGALAPRRGDPSLFTDLKASGYRIGVFSGQPEDFGDISETVRMRESADIFIDAEKLKDKRAFSFAAQGSLLVDEGVLLGEFDRLYGPAMWNRPNFLYFNFQTPHFPYFHDGVPDRVAAPLPRDEINEANKVRVQQTYWNAVAQADARLGELIQRLKALGVWDKSVLAVTGDHGESLFEDGFLGHGHIINQRQYATFFVVNRPGVPLRHPMAISDYRAVLLGQLTGKPTPLPSEMPFMHIGDLDAPTQIGMTTPDHGILSLRLDTGMACIERPALCADYNSLTPDARRAIDALVARWGSERWAARGR